MAKVDKLEKQDQKNEKIVSKVKKSSYSKKKKIKKTKEKKKGLSSLTKFTTKSLSGAFLNFKKKQEQKKIKDIKLKNLQENKTLMKERKELRIWEEKLKKENIKSRTKEDE